MVKLNKKYHGLFLLLLLFCFDALSCSGNKLIFWGKDTKQNKDNNSDINYSDNLKINYDIDTYSPMMSSAPGIGLSPNWDSKAFGKKIKYHWNTNYGQFIMYQPPDYKISVLGVDVKNDGEKIYWTFEPDSELPKFRTIEIILNIEDVEIGKTIAKSLLVLEKKESYLVEVKK